MTSAAHAYPLTPLAIEAIGQLKREERASLVRTHLRHPIGAKGWLGKAISRACEAVATLWLRSLRERTKRLASAAVWFEGARDVLIDEIARSGEAPSPRLIKAIEGARKSTSDLVAYCESTIKTFKSVNPASRVAEGHAQLLEVVERLDDSIRKLHELAVSGVQHEAVLTQIAGLQASVDRKLAQYLEDEEDFDAELVALADAAIVQINARARYTSGHH